jgi:hypothetical protein
MTCGGAKGIVLYPKTRAKVPMFGLDGKEILKKQLLIFHVVRALRARLKGDAFEALKAP